METFVRYIISALPASTDYLDPYCTAQSRLLFSFCEGNSTITTMAFLKLLPLSSVLTTRNLIQQK